MRFTCVSHVFCIYFASILLVFRMRLACERLCKMQEQQRADMERLKELTVKEEELTQKRLELDQELAEALKSRSLLMFHS